MEREVSLPEMLDARERRVLRQGELLAGYGLPVVSFCMNIAGPVKNGPAIRRAFQEGLSRLEAALAAGGMELRHRETVDRHTGCEALLAVAGDEQELKRLCVSLEDADPLGRLFDLDVLSPTAGKLDREAFGFPPRPCLICGRAGKSCASRRLHTVAELQEKTGAVLRGFFAERDGELLAAQALRALVYEVCTSPKPGLVDRFNSGSHRDMDLFTFLDSAAALLPYLRKTVSVGMETAGLPPEQVFPLLRREGLAAEKAMFAATGGVNTHKGAVFSLGTVCAAAGRLWTPGRPWAPAEEILAESGLLYSAQEKRDLAAVSSGPDTAGKRLYREKGLRGIRGELADGLPGVGKTGLPALRLALNTGASLEQAGLAALAAMMAQVTDTNLLARGGEAGARWAAQAAAGLSRPVPSGAELEALDREMIRRNLSPGGCADLLAITYFLYFVSQMPA